MLYDTDTTSSNRTQTNDIQLSEKDVETLSMLKQSAVVEAEIQEYNSLCWDVCVDKPGSKLDRSTEQCISNCVDRFLDTTIFVANRIAQIIQKNGGNLH